MVGDVAPDAEIGDQSVVWRQAARDQHVQSRSAKRVVPSLPADFELIERDDVARIVAVGDASRRIQGAILGAPVGCVNNRAEGGEAV